MHLFHFLQVDSEYIFTDLRETTMNKVIKTYKPVLHPEISSYYYGYYRTISGCTCSPSHPFWCRVSCASLATGVCQDKCPIRQRRQSSFFIEGEGGGADLYIFSYFIYFYIHFALESIYYIGEIVSLSSICLLLQNV